MKWLVSFLIVMLVSCSVSRIVENLEMTTASFQETAQNLEQLAPKLNQLADTSLGLGKTLQSITTKTDDILEQIEFILYVYATPALILLVVLLVYLIKKVKRKKSVVIPPTAGLPEVLNYDSQ